MSSGTNNIYVQSSVEQDNVKNTRKSLQTIQPTATNKENVIKRIPSYIANEYLTRSTSEAELKHKTSEIIIPKDLASTCSQTSPETTKQHITSEDLTSSKPSEVYWEVLAEKRRLALEKTLEENKELYEKVEELEAELIEKRELLTEAQALVEVFTEMLQDKEENEANEAAETQDVKQDNVSLAEEAVEEQAPKEDPEIQAEMDALYAAMTKDDEVSPNKIKKLDKSPEK